MKFTIGFVLTAIFLGFAAWIGGFDFNERSFLVAYGFVCCTFISVIGGHLLQETWQ